jgi:hypothetical protein
MLLFVLPLSLVVSSWIFPLVGIEVRMFRLACLCGGMDFFYPEGESEKDSVVDAGAPL